MSLSLFAFAPTSLGARIKVLLFCADDSFCLSGLRVYVGGGSRRAGGRPIKGPPTCQLECLYVSAYIGTGRIYLGAGCCCCSCCLGSHRAKVVGPPIFSSSLSQGLVKKKWLGVGGRIDVTSKDAGEQLAIVGIELKRIRRDSQENALKVFPGSRNYPSPFFVCWRLKSALAPSWAHREMNSPELFAVLLTLSVCLKLFLSLSLPVRCVCLCLDRAAAAASVVVAYIH